MRRQSKPVHKPKQPRQRTDVYVTFVEDDEEAGNPREPRLPVLPSPLTPLPQGERGNIRRG